MWLLWIKFINVQNFLGNGPNVENDVGRNVEIDAEGSIIPWLWGGFVTKSVYNCKSSWESKGNLQCHVYILQEIAGLIKGLWKPIGFP